MDFSPFMVVIGRNAAGKSNLFDAMQFLRLIAGEPLLEATPHMRGDLAELFHRRVDGSQARQMSFAVEVLLDRTVTDAFGDEQEITHSRLRYEVGLELRGSPERGERPFVTTESARLIRQRDDAWVQERFNTKQRNNLARYSGRSTDLLTTRSDQHGRPAFQLNQDRKQGRPRYLPAHEATATVLSSLTTATEFPHLYALKRELQSWRLLHLDPAALREPNSYDDPDTLAPNGAHLANTLYRIVSTTRTQDRPEGVLTDLIADLVRIVPEVSGFAVTDDRSRRQRQIEVSTRDGAPFTARVASDGTLRAIALMTALYDPVGSGLICFEEPENGIFPKRIVPFVTTLRDLVRRRLAARLDGGTAPLAQLVVSSHSPAILAVRSDQSGMPAHRQVRDDAVFLDTLAYIDHRGPKSRVTRLRRIAATDQPVLGEAIGSVVSPAEIAEFEVRDRLAG